MDDAPYAKARAWRRTGANLIDSAVVGGVLWLARSRGVAREGIVARLMAMPVEVLREQLRSPGQRLLGTRTVDRRTGSRVALWRTLTLIGVRAAGAELTRRLEPARTADVEREREAAHAEISEVMRRHPQATPERDAELRAARARHSRAMPSLWRTIAPSLAVGVIATRLRRRLAPTVEVLARRGDHSP